MDFKTTFWIKEIDWKKVGIISIIFFIVSYLVNFIANIVASKFTTIAPPPTNSDFLVMSTVFTLVTGAAITLIYYYLRDHLPTGTRSRVLYFADLMIGTYLVFFTLPTYLMFGVPAFLLLSWFITKFVILTATSFALVKIIK